MMKEKKNVSEPNLTAFDWAKPELGLGSGSGFLSFQVDAKPRSNTRVLLGSSTWICDTRFRQTNLSGPEILELS